MKKLMFPMLVSLALAVPFSAAPAFCASQGGSDIANILPKEQISKKKKFSANVKTMKYHKPGCQYYDCRDCTKFFSSAAAARKAGYEPCGVCRP